MSYKKYNIFVGKYLQMRSDVEDIYNNGISFDDGDLLVEQAKITNEGLIARLADGPLVALILQDGGFWPMITLLEPEEAKTLAHKLLVIAKRIQG